MLALDHLRGVRVVADPAAIDHATWNPAGVTVLRFAPDDAFGLDATSVEIDDEHAIVEDEPGFVGAWLDRPGIQPHVEWPLPIEGPALAQGSIAGVPAKVWIPASGDALLLTAAAYKAELTARFESRE